jgi:glycosyltransferase involved in cell wall biosynthesis
VISTLNRGGRFTYTELVGLPAPHPFAGFTEVVELRLGARQPLVSVIVPVYNKKTIISKILRALIENVGSTIEVIVVDDSSEDGTLQEVLSFFDEATVDFVIFQNSVPLYETACDNIGFSIARGDYLLELQADIYLKDPSFDLRMIEFSQKGNIGTVSGRCAHSWIDLYPTPWRIFKHLFSPFFTFNRLFSATSVGLTGSKVFDRGVTLSVDLVRGYIGDTNNRGPWMIPRWVFQLVGPLDSNDFFLGGDDHDFNYRAKALGLAAAYVPVRLETRAEDGSTRQERTGRNRQIYEYLLKNKFGERKLKLKLLLRRFTYPRLSQWS